MSDSENHQLERGKREELGGASRLKRTHTPPGPAPRLEARGGTPGGGAPRLGGPGGWVPQQPLEGWGGVGRGLLPHSLGGQSRPSPAPPPPFPTPRSGAAHAAAPCSVPPSLGRAGTGPCSPQPMAGQ